MDKDKAYISINIGMYGDSEDYYFEYKENPGSFDPVFLQGLLFADYIFKVYSEAGKTVQGEMFAEFLSSIKSEDVELLVEEKTYNLEFNQEKSSPNDIRFNTELTYTKEENVFNFEAVGGWFEEELYKLDLVNSVFELISFLGKKNKHNYSFLKFISEISNYSGEFFKKNIVNDSEITKNSFMIVLLAYENFLNDSFIM